MNTRTMLRHLGTLGIVLLSLAVGRGQGPAPKPAETAAARPAAVEELSTAEVLKSYLQVRDQLHEAQLAIANSRIEAEQKARAQSAAFTEKLETIRVTLEAERERHRAETERAGAERERQRLEMERTNRTILWVVVALGASVLLAVVIMPLLQWRAINRVAELSTQRAQLPAPLPGGLLAAETATPLDQAVTVSNQRLLSVIDRLERRILELEQTAAPVATTASTTAPTNVTLEVDTSRRRNAAADQASWIALLLAKGQSLLTANKAKEALVCFEEILKLNENHAETLVKKGAALERLKQDEAALLCYNRAIELEPRMTLAYLYKGGICNRLQRYEEAVECYEQALKAEEAGRKPAARG